MRNKLYFCFPIKGPNNGVKIISERLMQYLSEKDDIRIKAIDTSQAKNFKNFGKFNIRKVSQSITLLFKVVFLENSCYAYLNLTPVGFAFYRDMALIAIFRLKNCRINVHLHANGLERRINFFTRTLLRKTRIITINHYQQKVLLEKNLQSRVLPNALPDYFEKEGIEPEYSKSECLQLLFFSNLSKEKGIDRLVRIVEEMKRMGVPYELRICGGSLNEATELKLKKLLSKSKNVQYLGPIRDERKKIALFLESSFLLFLSNVNYEVYPLVYIEALMCGLPIISTEQVISARLEEMGCLYTLRDIPSDLSRILSNHSKKIEGKLAVRKRCRDTYKLNYNFVNYVEALIDIIFDDEKEYL
ncbi:MAG: glycosyltransferase family 4 protein [Bacteroidota bacterium]